MAGYRRPAPDAGQSLREGWFYTGDLAVVDTDGYLHLQGRRHDCINVGGFKVYPLEVEQVLTARPEVGEAAAFGVPDARLGQVVHAWVTPAPGKRLDTAALLAHCAEHLAGYKVPRQIGLADTLPRTSIGKLARNALEPVAAAAGASSGPISQ
ncbi:Long-chain-fatty-acid--CoA ligase [compost metagenome]